MKVTVAEFLAKGFKFVEGDKTIHKTGFNTEITDGNSCLWNDASYSYPGFSVVFPLAWRENTGEMPCDGDLWVDVGFSGEGDETIVAGDCNWSIYGGDCTDDITHWRPSIKNWQVEENQIEKAIRESDELVFGSPLPNSDSSQSLKLMVTMPTTAQGKRELAAQLLSEANELDKQDEIDERNGHEMFVVATRYVNLPDWDTANDDFKKGFIELAKQYTKK